MLNENEPYDQKEPYDLICEWFMWLDTKENHEYWRDVVDRLYKILREKKIR